VVTPEHFERWVDPIPGMDVINKDEPLVRFKFTRLHKTSQMVYTVSWLHGLGDGFSVHLFLTYVAHFYRRASVEHLPKPNFTKVFFPPPPSDPEMAEKFLPLMKHLRDAKHSPLPKYKVWPE